MQAIPHPETRTVDATRPHPWFGVTQALTLLVAAAFVALGIAGFVVTGVDHFADHDTGEHLLGFELNPLHNLIHLVIGLIGLLAWTRLRFAIAYGILLAVGYGAVAVYGTFAIHEEWDVLALNRADNWLHIAAAIVGLVIVALGTWQWRRERRVVLADDEVVIDLTLDERLADFIPESIHDPTPGHRPTGLPAKPRG